MRIYAPVKYAIIGSGNGLSPVRRQAINWHNAGLLSIGPLGINFSEIRIKTKLFILQNAFEIVVCEMVAIFFYQVSLMLVDKYECQEVSDGDALLLAALRPLIIIPSPGHG